MDSTPRARPAVIILLAFLLLVPPRANADPAASSFDPDAGSAVGSPREREVELMTDDVMARRAAESPDQMPRGLSLKFTPKTLNALSWSQLGPRPILREYWSGKADASGRVSMIAVDPRNANVVYAAAAQGGVWKSVDGGTTWMPLTDQLSSLASGALAFDPVNPDILYYGTGEQHYSQDSFYGDGLFRSSNAGATWSKIALKSSVGSYIARIAVKPTDSSLLFLASDLGVVRSTDGGSTWTVVLNGGHGNDLAIDPVTPSTVYAAIRGVGIYKSVDDGATWTLLGGGLPTADFLRINFGMSRSNPQVLYAGFIDSRSSTYGDLLGMFKTTDGGQTWTQLTSTRNYGFGQGWYDSFVTVDPSNSDICYAGGVFPYYGGGFGDTGLIKTTNGGTTWTDITIGRRSQLHPDQHFLTFGPNGAIWVGNDGGVWKSTDGGSSWIDCNHDLEITQFYTTGFHPTDATVLLGGTQDNGTPRSNGVLGWPQLKEGDGGPVAIEWDSPSVWYSTYVQLIHLYRWTSNGKSSKEVTGPWSGEPASWANSPLTVDPNVANTVLTGTNRVWKTPDSGTSWTAVSPDLTGGSGYLLALAVATGSSSVMMSGSSSGRVFVTTDGTSWSDRSAALPARPIRDVFLDPANSQIAYVCADQTSGDRVFASSDRGATWSSVTGDLPTGLRALSLAVDFRTTPDRLYLGTDYGVYSSTDGGAHWIPDAGGLPNCAVYDLNVDTARNRLLAATHGRGEWSSPITTSVAQLAALPGSRDDAHGGVTQGREIQLIAPSPFRTPVTIGYDLPRSDDITLEVFDVAGRRLSVVDRGVRDAGHHEVAWDGRDLAGQTARDGIYVLRLRAQGLGIQFARTIVMIR